MCAVKFLEIEAVVVCFSFCASFTRIGSRGIMLLSMCVFCQVSFTLSLQQQCDEHRWRHICLWLAIKF